MLAGEARRRTNAQSDAAKMKGHKSPSAATVLRLVGFADLANALNNSFQLNRVHNLPLETKPYRLYHLGPAAEDALRLDAIGPVVVALVWDLTPC